MAGKKLSQRNEKNKNFMFEEFSVGQEAFSGA
jgi:hypothetical protein